MKTYFILFIAFFAGIAFFSACTSNVGTKEIIIEENEFLVPTDTTLGTAFIDIKAVLPQKFSKKRVLDSIQRNIIAAMYGNEYAVYSIDSASYIFVKNFITEYREDNLPFLEEEEDEAYRYTFNYAFSLDGAPLQNDKRLFAYEINTYLYTGGAHGNMNRQFLYFDLGTGHKITESDLFINGYEEKLTELIKESIVKSSQNNPEIEPISDIDNSYYWSDQIVPNGNFFVTAEGINYVFNQYEIAPYVIGITEVFLPYNDIKDLLKPGNPIMYLFN